MELTELKYQSCSKFTLFSWLFKWMFIIFCNLLSITIRFVYETKYRTLRNIGEHWMSVLYTGLISAWLVCHKFPYNKNVLKLCHGYVMAWQVWGRQQWYRLRWCCNDVLSDAFSVHGGGGLWGVIATPILMKNAGVVYVWNKHAFMVRLPDSVM